jgi:AraC family transcriptional regulator
VLLARPGQQDRYRWDQRRRTRHGFFHFMIHPHGATLPDLCAWPQARQLPEHDIIRPLFHHLGWLLGRTDPDAAEQAQGVMRQALVAFLTGLVARVEASDLDLGRVVDRALAYIQEQWAAGDLQPVTLGDLARGAAVSKVHLTRAFQDGLGVSPIEALRQLRLDRAASLLARTNLEIQAVAQAVGFADAFHFSRAFRHLHGVPPRVFRQRVLAGEMPMVSPLLRTRQLAERMWPHSNR